MTKLPAQWSEEQGKNVLSQLKKYKETSRLQRACMNLFVKSLTDSEIAHLKDVFSSIDKDRSGYILASELVEACNAAYPESHIKKVMAKLDISGQGALNYTQFIAATLDAKHFLTSNRMLVLFRCFDRAHNGYITAEDIRLALNHTSHAEYSSLDIAAMLQDHGVDVLDHITFSDFEQIMKNIHIATEDDILEMALKLDAPDSAQ